MLLSIIPQDEKIKLTGNIFLTNNIVYSHIFVTIVSIDKILSVKNDNKMTSISIFLYFFFIFSPFFVIILLR